MSWNDERVNTLKKLWAEGHSASQIAKQLGGVTRNAVIGKVHRLGLSNRGGDGLAKEYSHGEYPKAEYGGPCEVMIVCGIIDFVLDYHYPAQS